MTELNSFIQSNAIVEYLIIVWSEKHDVLISI